MKTNFANNLANIFSIETHHRERQSSPSIPRENSRISSRKNRGYTIIEVMVAMALLAVTTSGIVALYKVTSRSNLKAKNMAIATQIARTWVERLRVDSLTWNYPSPTWGGTPSDLNETQWLRNAATQPNVWFRPAYVAGRGGAAFDAFGNDVEDAALNRASFCTHIRLSWMYPNEAMRADVRVFWLREGGIGPLNNQAICTEANAAAFDAPGNLAFQRYHFVYFSSAIAKNTAP